MGLIEEIDKGLKKVADFFDIREVHTERVQASGFVYDLTYEPLHHSEPYEPLTGQSSQVMTNQGAGFTEPYRQGELAYLYRIAMPKRRDQSNEFNL
jgi:hypothetical protein